MELVASTVAWAGGWGLLGGVGGGARGSLVRFGCKSGGEKLTLWCPFLSHLQSASPADLS